MNDRESLCLFPLPSLAVVADLPPVASRALESCVGGTTPLSPRYEIRWREAERDAMLHHLLIVSASGIVMFSKDFSESLARVGWRSIIVVVVIIIIMCFLCAASNGRQFADRRRQTIGCTNWSSCLSDRIEQCRRRHCW